jgi:hypothetical protein
VTTATTTPVDGTSPATTPQSTVPGQTTIATATTTTIAAPALPPFAVGDSVMAGAVNQLAAGGFAVSAEQNRQGTAMADILEQLQANGQLGEVVTIHAGTNGAVSAETWQRMMTAVAGVPTVVVLTVRADRSWTAGNNEQIRALPATYPNVRIADWEVESQNTELCPDDIHVACNDGVPAQFYANLVFTTMGRPDLVQPLPG